MSTRAALWVSVVSAMACGPVVSNDGGTTGSGSGTTTDPPQGTSSSDESTTEPCAELGCFDRPCEGPEDCTETELCQPTDRGSICVPIPEIDWCGNADASAWPVSPGGDGPVKEIRFVDADGDQNEDLAIVRSTALDLHAGPDVDSPLTVYEALDADLFGVVDGDFDNDGRRDLILVGDPDGGRLVVLAGALDGSLDAAFSLSGIGTPQRIERARWRRGDVLIMLGESGVVTYFTFASDFAMAGGSEVDLGLLDLDVAAFAMDGSDEIAGVAGDELRLYAEQGLASGSSTNLPLILPKAHGIVAGRFVGGEEPLGVAYRQTPLLLLEGSNRTQMHPVQAVPANADAVAVGDVDGDGAEDLVLLGGTNIKLAMGGGTPFRCYYEIDLPAPATMVAAGDLDGDGRDEIAVGDASAIVIVTLD